MEKEEQLTEEASLSSVTDQITVTDRLAVLFVEHAGSVVKTVVCTRIRLVTSVQLDSADQQIVPTLRPPPVIDRTLFDFNLIAEQAYILCDSKIFGV